jgi:hypothetical protein
MATRSAIAARHGTAVASIEASMRRLAAAQGIEVPAPPAVPVRQPEMKAAQALERVGAFMAELADQLAPQQGYSGASEGGDGPIDAETPETSDDGTDAPESASEAEGEEPEFAGHPLSYFDGMSEAEILAVPRVGEGTLRKIREAQGNLQ